MKRIRSLDLKYAASQVFYFAGFCATIGYASVYLLDKGFSNATIGIALAVSNIIAVVAQPLLASFIDKHEEIPLQRVAMVILSGVVVGALFIYLLPQFQWLLISLIVVVFAAISTLMPLMNSLAFVFEKDGVEINYGLARGIGSVAYALISIALGQVASAISPSVFPLLYAGFNAILIGVIYHYHLPKGYVGTKVEVVAKPENHQHLTLIQFAAKYKKFMLFMVSVVCVYFSHTVINMFFIQVITPIGGDSVDMGNAIFLAAMVELPMMAFFSKINEKINCGTLIKISILFFALKHGLTYLATDMWMIYAAQVLQMFAYALFIPASVYYVNQKIDDADKVKGQSLVPMAMTVSGVFGTLFGGILLDQVGVSSVLLIGVIVSIIGVVIAQFSIENV